MGIGEKLCPFGGIHRGSSWRNTMGLFLAEYSGAILGGIHSGYSAQLRVRFRLPPYSNSAKIRQGRELRLPPAIAPGFFMPQSHAVIGKHRVRAVIARTTTPVPSLRGAKRRSNPETSAQSWIASLRSQRRSRDFLAFCLICSSSHLDNSPNFSNFSCHSKGRLVNHLVVYKRAPRRRVRRLRGSRRSRDCRSAGATR
jgi:hypothetical protein